MEDTDRTSWIETVEDQGAGWRVNGMMTIPKSQVGGQASQVEQWIKEGGLVEIPPEPTTEALNKEMIQKRESDYVKEVLPLIIAEYKGEKTSVDVQTKITEIDNRYKFIEEERK